MCQDFVRLDFADSRFVNSFKFSLLTMSPGPDEGTSVQSKSKRKGRKGKERADTGNHAAAEQHPVGETVNAAQQLMPPWAWTILADSDASRCPPVFARDAKCVFLTFFAAQILIFRQGISSLHRPLPSEYTLSPLRELSPPFVSSLTTSARD